MWLRGGPFGHIPPPQEGLINGPKRELHRAIELVEIIADDANILVKTE